MAADDPRTWGIAAWLLVGLATYYTIGFFVHYFRFRRLEQQAAAGDEGALLAFNQAIRGFPGSGYAKMLGKRALVPGFHDVDDR